MKAFSIQNALAILITAGFFGVIGAWMYYPPPAENTTALATLNQLTGALTVAFAGIVSYFFGSSTGSKDKDDTIKEMSKAATGTGDGGNGKPISSPVLPGGHTPPTAP